MEWRIRTNSCTLDVLRSHHNPPRLCSSAAAWRGGAAALGLRLLATRMRDGSVLIMYRR